MKKSSKASWLFEFQEQFRVDFFDKINTIGEKQNDRLSFFTMGSMKIKFHFQN